MKKAKPPSPSLIKSTREIHGLTQTEAGELVHTSCRGWQRWEYGECRMHPATWELFQSKVQS